MQCWCLMPGKWHMRLCLLSEHSRACTGMHTPLSTSTRSACSLHEKGTPDSAQQAFELHMHTDEGGAHLVAAYTIWSAMSSAQAQRRLATFLHPQPSSRHQQIMQDVHWRAFHHHAFTSQSLRCSPAVSGCMPLYTASAAS